MSRIVVLGAGLAGMSAEKHIPGLPAIERLKEAAPPPGAQASPLPDKRSTT